MNAMVKNIPKPIAERDDYASPWKDLLDRWHRQFLECFFPLAAADIDWSRGHEFLDKELQKVTRRAVVGRRSVDKLTWFQRALTAPSLSGVFEESH